MTVGTFLAHPRGARYADVVQSGFPLDKLLEFLSRPHRLQRMVDSELWHDRPALAGCVVELERQRWFFEWMDTAPPNVAMRARMAVGVAVLVLMEMLGFQPSGRKGVIGAKARPASANAGAVPASGLSRYFQRSERYAKGDSSDER